MFNFFSHPWLEEGDHIPGAYPTRPQSKAPSGRWQTPQRGQFVIAIAATAAIVTYQVGLGTTGTPSPLAAPPDKVAQAPLDPGQADEARRFVESLPSDIYTDDMKRMVSESLAGMTEADIKALESLDILSNNPPGPSTTEEARNAFVAIERALGDGWLGEGDGQAKEGQEEEAS